MISEKRVCKDKQQADKEVQIGTHQLVWSTLVYQDKTKGEKQEKGQPDITKSCKHNLYNAQAKHNTK